MEGSFFFLLGGGSYVKKPSNSLAYARTRVHMCDVRPFCHSALCGSGRVPDRNPSFSLSRRPSLPFLSLSLDRPNLHWLGTRVNRGLTWLHPGSDVGSDRKQPQVPSGFPWNRDTTCPLNERDAFFIIIQCSLLKNKRRQCARHLFLVRDFPSRNFSSTFDFDFQFIYVDTLNRFELVSFKTI